jgi:Lipopolysaccharide-assembly
MRHRLGSRRRFVLLTSVTLASVTLAGLSAGCGYALAGRGSFLPADIRIVGIPQLTNQSTFFNVEQILSEKLRTEFIGRGKFTVVPTAAGADAVLSGTVTGISVQPVGFTDQQLASRYLFTMTMRVEFAEVSTGMVLWSNPSLVFRETYDLSVRGNGAVDGSTFLDQERASFDRIASDVARTVVTAIVEAF